MDHREGYVLCKWVYIWVGLLKALRMWEPNEQFLHVHLSKQLEKSSRRKKKAKSKKKRVKADLKTLKQAMRPQTLFTLFVRTPSP